MSLTRRRRLGIGLGIGVGLASMACDGREPTNPFDPQNPITGGRPDWLLAVAEDGAVSLEWRTAPSSGFAGYRIERALGEGAFGELAHIAAVDSISYRDTGLANGQSFTYRLSVDAADGESLALPAKVAAPGSVRPWIVENAGFGLLRTSPDGRHVRVRTGGYSGLFDAVSAESGRVWGADYIGDRLLRFSESGEIEIEIDIDLPFRMAVDATRRVVWAATWSIGHPAELFAFTFGGEELARVLLPNEIRDLEVEPATGACVGALGRARGIFRYAIGGPLVRAATHGQYMMVEVQAGGTLVAADPFTDRLVRFDVTTLAARDSVQLEDTPLTLHATGDVVWAAEGSTALRAYDAAFDVVREVDGVGAPTSLAYDAESDAMWVSMPTDGRVVRLSLGDGGRVDLGLFEPFLVVLASR